jgi:hypothetical protein
MCVEALSRSCLETSYHLHGSAGVRLVYRRHRADLVQAGCVRLEGIRCHRFYDAGPGAVFEVSSKAGPGKRGHIAVTYYTNNHSFAASLPGMRELFPRVLDTVGPAAAINADCDALRRQMRGGERVRPRLRLVVDNTKPV